MRTGRCHCGAIRYQMPDAAAYISICHCVDCRRHAGAPMVAWATVPADCLTIQGAPVTYASSGQGRRQFCAQCGTGLFYTNAAAMPGLVDVQTCTLDQPEDLPPHVQIHTSERLPWTPGIGALPEFPHSQT
ncbi:MAG: GFA family protein [Pseudomonadota bacterium]